MKHYDCIVVGVGGVGSAACYYLKKRNLKVLGIEQFPLVHELGSSHGQTRAIRQAYFENSGYVPLLKHSYSLWDELAQLSGKKLFERVGVLEMGPPDGEVIPGALATAKEHGLDVEEMSGEECFRRYPGFIVPDGFKAVLEKNAGYLRVEECVRAYIDEAKKIGVDFHSEEEVVNIRADRRGVTLKTTQGTYAARKVIVTAGPWASRFIKHLGFQVQVLRKSLFWYETLGYQNTPVFLYELPQGIFYGFPSLDIKGVKVAEHTGGQVVEDPAKVNREMDPEDQERMEGFVRSYLPDLGAKVTAHKVCLYTVSPDRHPVVGVHPQFPNLLFAMGLSGHGFKFASGLGESLSRLAVDLATEVPLDFLSCRRSSLFKGTSSGA